jgi:hypothetical protein
VVGLDGRRSQLLSPAGHRQLLHQLRHLLLQGLEIQGLARPNVRVTNKVFLSLKCSAATKRRSRLFASDCCSRCLE